MWKVVQSKALLSRSVLSPQPSVMECNEDTIVLTFPHIQNSPWKPSTKLIQFWGDQNCIFQQEKYSSPCRGEWNPSAVHSSHRLREDIIQKFPWSVWTQTSSGTAQAIQNTFKNNYKRYFQLVSFMLQECQRFKVLSSRSSTKQPSCQCVLSATAAFVSLFTWICHLPHATILVEITLTWFTQLVTQPDFPI